MTVETTAKGVRIREGGHTYMLFPSGHITVDGFELWSPGRCSEDGMEHNIARRHVVVINEFKGRIAVDGVILFDCYAPVDSRKP